METKEPIGAVSLASFARELAVAWNEPAPDPRNDPKVKATWDSFRTTLWLLREGGVVERGEPGLRAPRTTAREAARFLIARLAVTSLQHGAEAVRVWGSLVPVGAIQGNVRSLPDATRQALGIRAGGDSLAAYQLASGASFEDVITQMLAAPGEALYSVQRIVVEQSKPQAEIFLASAGETVVQLYGLLGEATENDASPYWPSWLQTNPSISLTAALSGGALRQAADIFKGVTRALQKARRARQPQRALPDNVVDGGRQPTPDDRQDDRATTHGVGSSQHTAPDDSVQDGRAKPPEGDVWPDKPKD
jgi:hypothetical protein